MKKLIQIKSGGVSLRADLEGALRQLSLTPAANHFGDIQSFVKEKQIKDFSFAPHKDSLITFLFPSEVYKKSFFSLEKSMIVYEDDAVVVIDKPPGLSTQSTQKFGEDHLYGAVISYFTNPKGNKLAYVGLHHRLDRDTSGLVLFTKKSSANKSIADQFRNHQVIKKYHAVVVGDKPEKQQWTCEEPISRDFSSDKIFRFKTHAKGDSAKTHFCWIQELSKDCHLIECTPQTGRTHQIRIHLKFCGLPILGDRTYSRLPYSRMMLHAWSLQLKHPLLNKELITKSAFQLAQKLV